MAIQRRCPGRITNRHWKNGHETGFFGPSLLVILVWLVKQFLPAEFSSGELLA